MYKTPIRGTFAALFGLCLLAACSDDTSSQGPAGMPGPGGPAGPVEVGVLTLSPQDVPRTVELPARVVALATAEVRPQVDGIVKRQVFVDGAEVKAGDALYELDPTKFQAAFDAVSAAARKAEVTVAGAQTSYDRTASLQNSAAVSVQALDDARTTLEQAKADVAVAQADVATAQINLDNTTIRASIAGLIGRSSISVGSLVTANQTDALAVIRQLDPINIDLVDSSANLLRIRAELANGTLGRSEGPAKVQLTLENGQPYDTPGEISGGEVVVSETTGTFSIRAKFDNPKRILMPGMFVRASVSLGATKGAFLVPQRAVTRNDAGEATAFFVSNDNKAERRVLTTTDSQAQNWVVTGGVAEGDRLIVDGLQKISNGSAVKPLPVAIDANGVVEQTIDAPAAGAEVKK